MMMVVQLNCVCVVSFYSDDHQVNIYLNIDGSCKYIEFFLVNKVIIKIR